MSTAPGYEEAVAKLESRGFGIKPGLERMEQLVRLMDNPQLTYPTIHITGTNGKTSTAHIAGAILAAHGLKTGVYTSPHLETVRERFLLAGFGEGKVVSEIISEEDFAATLAYLTPYVELIEGGGGEPGTEPSQPSAVTYFELTTLAAFEWMAEKAVAAGVLEAGMGGRWDATNVIEADVAILCSIGVDHAGYLGSTPEENAREKTGIIKMRSSVVSGPQLPEVSRLIDRAAAAAEARLLTFGKDFRIEADQPAVGGRLITLQTGYGRYRDLYLPLHGAHQAQNLAVAVVAAELFREERLEEAALRVALEGLRIPGRLEIVVQKPLVILDGAHNPSAAGALAAALRESFSGLPITMVISILEDKDASGILGHLAPLAKRLILTRSSSPRAADPVSVKSLVPPAAPAPEVLQLLKEAVDEAVSTTPQDEMVLVSGSLYGVGEARAHLLAGRGVPPRVDPG